ncbi:Xanthine and CO dehydrogenases maturation factor, XdhC/CoxF family [hydrothermal vent metagenome]|uniref:Xanthine and CO dehydrogenases maturation factor, XdhC/CoxF family n=1 Tax=hydrothermal vent metagenome TaxID=652676 RepID=A0A3B0TZ31_9ZZZZ
MSVSLSALERFMDIHPQMVLVEILHTAGSSPREKGAFMLIAAHDMVGTIGGGQLEYIVLGSARRMLAGNKREHQLQGHQLQVALGPETGQCCGGNVTLGLRLVNKETEKNLRQLVARKEAQYRHVYIMGAGHVGRALAGALAPLPFKTIVVDTRRQALEGLPKNVERRFSALPEAEVRAAPPASAFVVVTHDHALDFLIVREALSRNDCCYVGMIGSKSKRAVFASWLEKEGERAELVTRLVCPIGGDKVKDKRPEIIAALVVSEILVHTQKLQSGKPIKINKTAGVKSGGEKIGVR